MNPDQIDIALAELETRLDRLRALYEQYFMGIERLEPQVPRKDVERRFHDLRKTPFRNTAKRFKFQTLTQRYSTMQQYWGRICREIENGTYKRHKLKAERSLVQASLTEAQALTSLLDEARTQPGPEARARIESELGALLDSGLDTDAELERALTAALAPTAPPVGKGLLGRLAQAPAPAEAQQSTTEPTAPLARAVPPAIVTPPLSPARAPAPLPALPQLPGSRGPLPPRPVAPGGAPLPPRPVAPGALPAPRSLPLPPPRPVPPPRPATEPQRPTVAAMARAATEPQRPTTTATARAATEPQRPTAAASLAEDRIRALHKSYLEARAQTNASAVSYEKLAQNLRETERKLREQHKGRNVDFDVVVKDGKAILKPRLR